MLNFPLNEPHCGDEKLSLSNRGMTSHEQDVGEFIHLVQKGGIKNNAAGFESVAVCEGWDSNPRTPSRLAPQASAFDLARQPSRVIL